MSSRKKKCNCGNATRKQKFYNDYHTFEDKVEEAFKKSGIDFTSSNYNLEKEMLKAHKAAISPSNINPRTDYYTYINERWINEFAIDKSQKYIVQVDDFRLVQDKVYKELLEIVKDYTHANHSPKAKCIKIL
jgi:hypothetical protein